MRQKSLLQFKTVFWTKYKRPAENRGCMKAFKKRSKEFFKMENIWQAACRCLLQAVWCVPGGLILETIKCRHVTNFNCVKISKKNWNLSSFVRSLVYMFPLQLSEQNHINETRELVQYKFSVILQDNEKLFYLILVGVSLLCALTRFILLNTPITSMVSAFHFLLWQTSWS